MRRREIGKSPKKIIIFGTGGNCIDILDSINEINSNLKWEKYTVIGFLDDDPAKLGKEIHGAKVLGPLRAAQKYGDSFFVNGIGSPNSFLKKETLLSSLGIEAERYESIVHPSARISALSKIGKGTVVLQNVVIASNAQVGNHVIILPNSIVSHDDVISDYTCIAGGACISGEVHVGKSCYIGTNCSLIGRIRVGDHSLIGMGSVVLKDVPPRSIVAGNPARILRKIQ
jgi:sugar O-acyltransferase (sialic acid O-acetyltransferase NeuD family)